MARTDRTKAAEETVTEIPEQRSEETSQVAVRESMDIDPSTGMPIRVGVPERSAEDSIAAFITWLQEQADNANVDSMAMLADMLRRADSATSVAEALKEKATVNGRDFVGIPFLATGFTIREGRWEDDELPYYASIDAVLPDRPDGIVINCGGMKILVHLRTLARLNQWPLPLVITGKETRKGHQVLSFELLKQTPV